jgi:hypothetical protein
VTPRGDERDRLRGDGGVRLGGVGLGPGAMDGVRGVLRWGVDGVQAQVDGAPIHDVVAHPRGNVDETIASDRALLALQAWTSSPISSLGGMDINTTWALGPVETTFRKKLFSFAAATMSMLNVMAHTFPGESTEPRSCLRHGGPARAT